MKKKVSNIIISMLFISIFGILFPVCITYKNYDLYTFIIHFIVFYSTIKLMIIINGNRLRPLEISFYVFTYVFLGIAPMVQVSNRIFPWHGVYGNQDILFASLIIITGILFYDIGNYFQRKFLVNNYSIKMKNNDYKVTDLYKINILAIILLIFSLVFIGVDYLVTPRNLIEYQFSQSQSLILTKLMQVPIFISLIITIIIFRNNKDSNFINYKIITIISIIIVMILLNIFISNPISSARYWVGTVYLAIILSLINFKLITQKLLIFMFILLFLIIFPYADLFRNSLDSELIIRGIDQTFSKGDFDAFQQIMNTGIFTDFYDFSFGYQLLGVFFFWVPRVLWPSKPVGTGSMVGEGLQYDFVNISAPLWAEMYINFSVIGVIILFFIYGFLTSIIQSRYEISLKYKQLNFYSVFVPIFTFYQIMILRGDLLSSFAYLFPIIIFIIIGLKLISNRKKGEL